MEFPRAIDGLLNRLEKALTVFGCAKLELERSLRGAPARLSMALSGLDAADATLRNIAPELEALQKPRKDGKKMPGYVPERIEAALQAQRRAHADVAGLHAAAKDASLARAPGRSDLKRRFDELGTTFQHLLVNFRARLLELNQDNSALQARHDSAHVKADGARRFGLRCRAIDEHMAAIDDVVRLHLTHLELQSGRGAGAEDELLTTLAKGIKSYLKREAEIGSEAEVERSFKIYEALWASDEEAAAWDAGPAGGGDGGEGPLTAQSFAQLHARLALGRAEALASKRKAIAAKAEAAERDAAAATAEAARLEAAADAEAAWDHYEARGWKSGKSIITRWKSCINTCYANFKSKPKNGREPQRTPTAAEHIAQSHEWGTPA